MNRLTLMILIYTASGSNRPNNHVDVTQPGLREWREAGFHLYSYS
jgi:hypothetical protein